MDFADDPQALAHWAEYYKAVKAFYIDVKKQNFYHEVAQIYEARGQIDQAMSCWQTGFDIHNETIHSIAVQALLKSPSATNESLLEIHRKWAEKYALPEAAREKLRFTPYSGQRKIHIGYICAWWDSSTIRGQAIPFIEKHDRFRFKITAYSLGPCSDKQLTQNFDNFVDIGAMSHEAFADRVREDQVDVLCEFTGFSPHHRFAAMGSRCAPVQVSYLNHTGTSGVANVDYVIADDISAPSDIDPFFTEKIYRVPGTFFCFNYDWDKFPDSGQPPCLRQPYFTFGCFGSQSKVNDVIIRLWAQLLHAVPNSRLFLRNYGLSSPANRNFMERRFAQWGITSDRLRLEGGADRYQVLKDYALVDVSLDTWPYCGGNTIAESLWQGVPVITLKGDMFAHSYGASLLHSSGCPELVAETPADYVAIGARLASDKEKLVHYRKNLRGMMHDHGFADAEKFARKMEAAFEDMLWRAFHGDEPVEIAAGDRV
jgi:protein O-GlcNAc transferase